MGELEPVKYAVKGVALLPRHEHFVQEYVLTGNLGKSYIAAFGKEQSKTPTAAARSLLRRPEISLRVREHQEALAVISSKSAAVLLHELEQLVEADVNDLMTLKVGSCRYCWGVGGGYQWRDEAELEAASTKAIEERKPVPDCGGGFGYQFGREPNPGCKHCEGEGIQRVLLRDTEELSPGARRLFKGVECHPDGSIKKVLIHDQLAARQELHRLRGLHIERSMSVSVSASLPNAKEIAADPSKAMDYLDSLKTVK